MKRIVLALALMLSACGPWNPRPQPKPPIVVVPPQPPIVTPPIVVGTTGETGLIDTHDRQFWNNGQAWTWAGNTDFLIWSRHLHGEDIRPQLEQRVSMGSKVLRVFGMVDSFSGSRPEPVARLYPQEHPDYYSKLQEFIATANLYGLRVEFTLFADAAAVMPDQGMQDAYAENVFVAIERASIASGLGNFEEGCNECMFDSNLPGGEERAWTVMRRFQGRSPFIRVSSGAYNIDAFHCQQVFPYTVGMDYYTMHSDRGDEWPRKQIDLREHRDGFQWEPSCGGTSFAGVRIPAVSDEPRALDESVWGSRTTDTIAAGQAGAVAAMMGNGITCHSQDGLLSNLLGPIQTEGCTKLLTAARFIAPAIQTLNYARGGDQGACAWAYGPSPVEHTEGPGMRSFTKWIGDQFWVVQAGSYRPTVTACPGFTLTSEPVQGVALLRQQ